MFQFSVDTSDLDKMAKRLARFKGTFPKELARSMTYAAYDAQKKLRQETPRFVDKPTPGTKRATFVEPATPERPVVRMGFRDEAPKGTAPARYLQPMVAGGPRPLKRSERQLQATGLLRSYEFITPTGVYPLKLNQYGNISGPAMVQVLSRLGGFSEQGSTMNRSSSRRSQAKRRQRDYFIGEPGGLPRGIYARVGRNNRGFHTVFNITRQPTYQPTFPVRSILQQEFGRRWPGIFERLVFRSR